MRTRTSASLIAPLFSAIIAFGQAPGTIITVAGTGTAAYNGDNIAATLAQLNEPAGVATDPAGNIYIADEFNRRIRKITAATGKISTIAGTGVTGFNGDNIAATSAQLQVPRGLFIDSQGNLYLTDLDAGRVRKISSSGIITTIAGTGVGGYSGDGGAASGAKVSGPDAVVVDAAGNVIFTDTGNSRIRKVTPAGIISTIAGTGVAGYNGDGLGTSTQLFAPQGLAIDSAGNIYFCDENNQRIRELTASGQVVTLAGTGTAGYNGDGLALSTKLDAPFGLALDSSGRLLFTDVGNQRVRTLSADHTQITTIAGTNATGYNGDGIPATTAELYEPGGVAIDSAGNVYIGDVFNERVREIISSNFTYYFSDLAFAGGFQTTLTYINYSPQSVSCTTTFYSDAGQPLSIPFSSGTFATRVDVLPPGGSLHESTNASLTAAVTEGWAQASCTGPVQAGLLYRLYSNGTPVGEASVNAETSATTEFATFAQAAGGACTGVAYANPSTTLTANVTITAYDASGVMLGSKGFQLDPLHHGASNVGPFLNVANFAGFIEITSDNPIVTLSLNAEAFPVFSSLPPGDLPSSTPLVGRSAPVSTDDMDYAFADLAFSGGYQTTLTYANYSPASVTCTTQFYDDLGQPLQIPFSSGLASIRNDVLPPGGTLHDTTTASLSDSATQGWAVALCSGPVQASLLYRLYNNGIPVSEASVNGETALTKEFATFAQTATAIADANASPTESASITVTAYNTAGVKLGSHVLTLGPMQHGSSNIGPLLGITNFTGFVKIVSSIPIFSLSLNAEAFPVFSSLPPGDLPSATPLVP